MSDITTIVLEEYGCRIKQGTWSGLAAHNLIKNPHTSRHKIISVDYPILAASVSKKLGTDTFLINVEGKREPVKITLRTFLPKNAADLVSIINRSVSEEFQEAGLETP